MKNINRSRYNAAEKKEASSAIIPAALGIILVGNAAAASVNGSFIVPLLAVCVIVGILVLLFSRMNKLKKTRTNAAEAQKKKAGRTGKMKFGFTEKERALEDKPSFSKASSAPVVYNERSAEELFLRDRQKRLEQLEVFLKNGIIDKNEYILLKKRYENYSYERN